MVEEVVKEVEEEEGKGEGEEAGSGRYSLRGLRRLDRC